MMARRVHINELYMLEPKRLNCGTAVPQPTNSSRDGPRQTEARITQVNYADSATPKIVFHGEKWNTRRVVRLNFSTLPFQLDIQILYLNILRKKFFVNKIKYYAR